MIWTESNKWLMMVGGTLLCFLLYLLSPVLTPFLFGALLAYLGDPIVDRLEARKISRTSSVIIVFILILIVLICLPFVLLPLIEQQFSALNAKLPIYIDWAQKNVLPYISSVIGVDIKLFDVTTIKQSLAQHWQQMGGIASYIVRSVSQSSLAVIAWLANIVLIPVVTFYLLRDWDALMQRLRELLPRQYESTVITLLSEVDTVLGAFLRGQLLVMTALSGIYASGLWLVGLDLALMIGMVAGLVSFVPYLGFIVGLVLAVIAALMQFGDPLYLVYVLVVFGLGQLLEGMVLTPTLVGDKIGLHPVAVIFSIMAGGQLFGMMGILLALPVAAVVMVLLRHIHQRYRQSALYND